MMDTQIINQIVLTVGVPFFTQLLKKADSIPWLQSGQTARIRTFVGIVFFIATAANAWLNGDLSSFISPQMIQVALTAGISWLVAHVGYKVATASQN